VKVARLQVVSSDGDVKGVAAAACRTPRVALGVGVAGGSKVAVARPGCGVGWAAWLGRSGWAGGLQRQVAILRQVGRTAVSLGDFDPGRMV